MCKRDGNIRPKYNIDDKLFVIGEINGKNEVIECKIRAITGSRARFKYTISKIDSCFPNEFVNSFELWQDELDNRIYKDIFLDCYTAIMNNERQKYEEEIANNHETYKETL